MNMNELIRVLYDQHINTMKFGEKHVLKIFICAPRVQAARLYDVRYKHVLSQIAHVSINEE